MPPSIPRKRPPPDNSLDDLPPSKCQAAENVISPSKVAGFDSGFDSDSSLSDAPSSDTPTSSQNEDADNDDVVDWEDAIGNGPSATTTLHKLDEDIQDLELTLNKNEAHISDLLDGKKAPTKIERQIRMQTHRMHVQCLLFHNAIRNTWLNDSRIHGILRRKLPASLHKEYQKWRVASGLESYQDTSEELKKKEKKRDRNWGGDSSLAEPKQPDMSSGDPIIRLLKVLSAYWKKQFKITAPGLRKLGYRPMSLLQAEISSFQNGDHDPDRHGEKLRDVNELCSAAERMEGSRDVGAQLFTGLLRALGIEARLVASLQPLGFGWTKSESFVAKIKTQKESKTNADIDFESDGTGSGSVTPKNIPKGYDLDLQFPVYWTEVASPITHDIIPVDPLVLPNAVATTPELRSRFEPRGIKAEKAKQVICYVVAFSQDKTAKDVTTRYLRRRVWPGKTKGYRIPARKIPNPYRKGLFYGYDWFRTTMGIFGRDEKNRTKVDDLEDAMDLLPNQPDRKSAKEVDTLQGLRSSSEVVLERFLRREEALRPDAKHVRIFVSGKGNKTKEEKVYRRTDVLRCLSAESWHKEGRQIKTGELPLKRVPIRAVTLVRKREVEELERITGEKPKQGLYAEHQTEYIIPPPICDGIIPKNEYGNIDCFVPHMVPRGASHVPWPGTVRICKKLGIDYAEAVTGFEFGSKIAVPVIEGVVVATENEDLLKDAWLTENADKKKREQLKAEKRILQTWRKFLFGLRIAERIREEYGISEGTRDTERETQNPFSDTLAPRARQGSMAEEEREEGETDDPATRGGGFLLPEEDNDSDVDLIVERHDPKHGQSSRLSRTGIDDNEPVDPSFPVSPSFLSGSDDDPGPSTEYHPPSRRKTRFTK